MTSRTYGNLFFSSESGHWIIDKLEPHVALRFKQLFPRVPKHSSGPFNLNANVDTAADLQWFLKRYPLCVRGDDADLLEGHASAFYAEQAEAERILLPEWEPTIRPGLLPGERHRNYQLQALDFIDRVRQLLLVDDIGLGKTYEGLGVALLTNALPQIIVVEPHNQIQWIQKASSFINLRVHAAKGTRPYDLPNADIYIFKYTQLAGWVDVLTTGWLQSIVFDEIQNLRNGASSAKGQAASEIIQTIDIRVGLSATPLYNFGIEIFNIIDCFIKPGLLGSRQDFLREWCTDSDGRRGIVQDPDALGTYLRESLVFLRRTKADVGQEAKQVAPHIEWVEADQDGVKESEELAEQLAIRTLNSGFAEAGRAAREFDLRLRELTGIAKAKATAGYVRMLIETGTPVLLFGWHREVYRIWAKELADLNPLFYTGTESPTQKEKAKKDFIEGKSDLLIMSLRSGAGADGIQHRCSTAVFGEFDWSPEIHKQCIGRLDRDGQLYEVFAFYVATNFGSDPHLIDVLGLKAGQSRGIKDPGMKEKVYQADVNRIKNLARDYLKLRGCALPDVDALSNASNDGMELPAKDQLALI
ncbi:SNF2-related protein [Microbulbifer epialgicus]|uniref:SNF2-related protein n=1 Tax=Microbulbifer epialgicus TaxID=393907 RepID=A0ABV4NU66_9GAMM